MAAAASSAAASDRPARSRRSRRRCRCACSWQPPHAASAASAAPAPGRSRSRSPRAGRSRPGPGRPASATAGPPSPRRCPTGVPVAITSPGSSVQACDRISTWRKQSKISWSVLDFWRSSPLTNVRMPSACGSSTSSAVVIHGPDRPVRVERLGQRPLRRLDLPVAHADVVDDQVAGDDVGRVLGADVPAAPADDEARARPRSRGSRRPPAARPGRTGRSRRWAP